MYSKIYANVLLLDGMLWQWTTRLSKKGEKEHWTMRYSDFDLPLTYEYKEFIAEDSEEHHRIFTEDSIEWYRQFPIHPKYHNGLPPYDVEEFKKKKGLL